MEEIHESRDDEPAKGVTPPRLLPPRGPAPVLRPADAPRLDHSLAPSEPGEAPPSQALTRYDELDVLGSGGSGVVTLAVDRETGERVAIKRLRQTSADRVRRFRREADTIAALDHPGIVKLLQVVEGSADELALVLELVEGPTLSGILRADGRLSLNQSIEIGVSLAEALAYAHEQGIVHRDVKPSNVLIDENGRAKLVDFGLALPRETLQTMTPTAAGPLGTLDYMAPEQWSDAHGVDGRADIYSLGATLYRLLTGNSPRVIREGRIPAAARELILRCVEEEPEERYPSMTAVAAALRAVLGSALADESGVFTSLERVNRELSHDLDQAKTRSKSQRLLIAAAGLESLGALPEEEARALSARLALGASVDALVAGVVGQIIASVRGRKSPRLLADAHAILSAALGRRSLGAEGGAALVRLSEASREPVLADPVESLAAAIKRLVVRRALTGDDARALATVGGTPAQFLDAVLAHLRARARSAATEPEWAVNEAIWSHALDDLRAALPHPGLAARVERERLALRMERLAREAE